MRARYPYVPGPDNITKVINHLRHNFDDKISSSTFKKAGTAKSRADDLITALNFIGIIDENGNKKREHSGMFYEENEQFEQKFGNLVKKAYLPLFEERGNSAWTLSKNHLAKFFAQAETKKLAKATVNWQAETFIAFAELAGELHQTTNNHREPTVTPQPQPPAQASNSKISLAGKFEIHLPAGGTKEDYDNIFKSIKENIIND